LFEKAGFIQFNDRIPEAEANQNQHHLFHKIEFHLILNQHTTGIVKNGGRALCLEDRTIIEIQEPLFRVGSVFPDLPVFY
jgi:hypothetical protein